MPGVIAPAISRRLWRLLHAPVLPGLPRELEEAAYIDGASRLAHLCSCPAAGQARSLATLGIITFLAAWNDFLWPLLILGGKRTALTLPVGLATLQGQYNFDYGKLMAGALILTVPVLILYTIFQRYIIRSISMTGIKG